MRADLAPKKTESPKIKVLMIEGESLTRGLLVRMLNKCGVTDIVETSSAEQAWSELVNGKARDATVILTETALPGASGISFLKNLRGFARTKSIPVVVLSTDNSTAGYASLRPFNIGAYLIKPVSGDLLKTALERAIEGARMSAKTPLKWASDPQRALVASAQASLFISLFQSLTAPRPTVPAAPASMARNLMA